MAVEDDTLVVCERWGHRWDGLAQCDCHFSKEDEEVVDVEKENDSCTDALSGLQAMVDKRNRKSINLLDDILPTKVPPQPRLKLILPKPVGTGPDPTVIEFPRRNTGGKPSTFEALQMGIEDKTAKKKVKV